MKIRTILLSAMLIGFPMSYCLGEAADVIKLNQVGYYPQQEKIIVVEGTKVSKIKIMDANGKVLMSVGKKSVTTSPISGKKRTTFDVSSITTPGTYTVVAGKDKIALNIKEQAWSALGKAAIKSLYYQRTGMPLTKEYAGKWARPAGHMDTEVYIHPASAEKWRPAGTVLASPKGWYDAGDYNKYASNSSFTMGMMLGVYEMMPEYFKKQTVDIPEKGNKTADLLDEIMWNLDWLFTMQDRDGGVYHKLTTPDFEGFVMPSECHQKRYMTAKSVTGSLGFAAVMAQSARVFAGSKDYAGVEVRALNAAKMAYEWAKKHPTAYYLQDENNDKYEPKITTGKYDDNDATGEFFWAAVELYLTTGEKSYLDDAIKYEPKKFILPVWGEMGPLGTYELCALKSVPEEAKTLVENQRKQLMDYVKKADNTDLSKTSFYTPFGNSKEDFCWGCNSECCATQGITMLYAYNMTKDINYLKDAERDADYLLGRNATGYCYVTGFGEKSPMHPHHRLSSADGIEEPVPGLLVGGPNPGQQDGAEYKSNFADESYSDTLPSYASNEIAINWCATLVALINGIEGFVEK